MLHLLLPLGLTAGHAAFAGCVPEQLDPSLAEAEESFASGDPAATVRAFSRVRRTLSCVDFALSPQVCARIHRASALTQWIEGDDPGSLLSLRAMRHADPTLGLPRLAPEHPLRRRLVEAEEAETAWAPAGANGAVLVDGLRTGVVPIGQPYLLQPLDEDGIPLKPRIVERLATASASASGPKPVAKTLRWTGVGLAIGAAAAYGSAWGTRAAHSRAVDEGNDDAIRSTHAVTNGLAIGSVVLTSLAGGAILVAEAVK